MANYNSCTTSNAFRVKDINLFQKELEKMDGMSFFEIIDGNVFVASYEGLYSFVYDKERGCDVEYEYECFIDLIQKHIEDDEKVFVSSIGNEKLRYLSADCCIVTKDNIIYKNFFNEIIKEYNLNNDIF